MKQVIIRQGAAVVEEVPAPQVEARTVLVRVEKSCISVGTEMLGVRSSGMPLWKKAMQHPERLKKVVQIAASQGITQAKNAVAGKLGRGSATGYSAAGVVVAVGEGIDDIRLGGRVACAGAQCAYHAEMIRVPRNLLVRVPEGLPLREASSVALGAIAMQGVRRANPALGENFVVVGLGVLGQLVVQLLKANGCRVIGVDLDSSRVQLATELGMEVGLLPEDGPSIQQVVRVTDGIGADGAIITAATPSDEVLATAFKMCRKKGRVVLVGDVGLNINRSDIYAKEIDFFISTSYGPGRYDSRYEEDGIDYPVSYVRWTENRNMSEYLRLVADGRVRIEPLTGKTFSIDEARAAYDSLKAEGTKPLMVFLHHPDRDLELVQVKKVLNPTARPLISPRVRFAVVGAGGFAQAVHLPNIKSLAKIAHLQAVVSRTGHNATATCRQFGANYAATDYAEVIRDPEVDAVVITTRHDLHARMALEALNAGKHVLVEKPLALTMEELAAIEAFYEAHRGDTAPLLLTGFNRRFSKYMRSIKRITDRRSNPMLVSYRMNAGYVPLDHWTHLAEGGGRNRGEACHIYDLFTFLTGAKVVQVTAQNIRPTTAHYSRKDNFSATLTFEDGSVASLIYTALGCGDYPKEHLEIYVDGKVIRMTDYMKIEYFGVSGEKLSSPAPDKGQRTELAEFIHDVQSGRWTVPLWQQIQATEIALKVEEILDA